MREALQNSWDARLRDAESVGFSWHLLEIGIAEASVLQQQIFAQRPPDGWSPGSALDPGSKMLAFADTGTTGLRGPTRADWATGEHTEFVDFVRNHGRTKRDAATGQTAGTFGFGKSALLNVSSIRTAIVYTRCANGDDAESRLIAMALGKEFVADYDLHPVTHTGRHWWGAKAREGDRRVDPVIGSHADELAEKLGLRALLGDATGTVVALLQPTWGEHTEEESEALMREQALRYAWPVIDSVDAPQLQVSQSWLGSQSVVRPRPGDYVHIAFAKCLAAIDGRPDPTVHLHDVLCHRPRRRLGTLAFTLIPVMPQPLPSLFERLGEPLHHIALMRDQRLVLRYLPVEAPAPGWQIVGVFLSDPDLAALFAASETATHDDWIPERLKDRTDRSLVRVAKVRIAELARSALDSAQPQSPAAALPLGAFSSYLGAWLVGSSGSGASVSGASGEGGGSPDRGTSRGGGSRRSLKVVPADEPRSITIFDGKPATVVPFVVRGGGGYATVSCAADVVVDGARPEGAEAPLGAAKPQVLAWLDSNRRRLGNGERISAIFSDTDTKMYAVVSLPQNSMVALSITAELAAAGEAQ